MKKILLLLTLIISVLAQAQKTGTSSNARVMAQGDPNLDPNWDWTAVAPDPGHRMYYAGPDGVIREAFAQSPFRKNGDDYYVSNGTNPDMFREDGWQLVYRDFGTATGAPHLPFFIIYNKFRGLMRVFVLNVNGYRDDYYEMRLMFRNDSPKPALFTCNDTNPTEKFLNKFNSSGILRYIGVNTPGMWYSGEFLLAGFDPNIPSSTVLRLELDGLNSSKIILDGSIVANGSVNLEGIITGTGNLSGYYGVQNNSAGLLNGGLKFLLPLAGETILSNIVRPNADRLIKATEKQKIGPVVDLIGKTLKNVTGFLGSNKYNYTKMPISLKMSTQELANYAGNIAIQGTLNLTGTLESLEPIWRADFALSNLNQVPGLYKPVRANEWGIVNISSNVLTNEIISTNTEWQSYVSSTSCSNVCTCGYNFDEYGNAQCGCSEDYICEDQVVHFPSYTVAYKAKLKIRFNPNLGASIQSVRLIRTNDRYTYRTEEYELETKRLSNDEFELTTPVITDRFADTTNTEGPNLNNATHFSHLIIFYKVDQPGRAFPNDDLVIIQQIGFGSNQDVFPSAGGRMAMQEETPLNFTNSENEGEKLTVAPNPLSNKSGTIVYRASKDSRLKCEIIDASGKVMLTKEIFGKKGINRIPFSIRGSTEFLSKTALLVCRVTDEGQVNYSKVVIGD